MKISKVVRQESSVSGSNWMGPKDLFPTIEVDQSTGVVTVTTLSVNDQKAIGCTHECSVSIASDNSAVLIRGMTGVKNWKHPKCGGRQSFCYAVFEGDSGHLYTHRAQASKGWMECRPKDVTKRLRKLGVGADEGVIQQGDYLLKPANGSALPVGEFKHEFTGSGHHRFVPPVLYAHGNGATHVLVQQDTILSHHATDGVFHPAQNVPPGQYIIGTTSPGLRHSNARD